MRTKISNLALTFSDIEFQEKEITKIFSAAYGNEASYFLDKLKDYQKDFGNLGGAYHFLTSYLDDKNFALLAK